jgi:hypothetical protein
VCVAEDPWVETCRLTTSVLYRYFRLHPLPLAIVTAAHHQIFRIPYYHPQSYDNPARLTYPPEQAVSQADPLHSIDQSPSHNLAQC